MTREINIMKTISKTSFRYRTYCWILDGNTPNARYNCEFNFKLLLMLFIWMPLFISFAFTTGAGMIAFSNIVYDEILTEERSFREDLDCRPHREVTVNEEETTLSYTEDTCEELREVRGYYTRLANSQPEGNLTWTSKYLLVTFLFGLATWFCIVVGFIIYVFSNFGVWKDQFFKSACDRVEFE